MTLKVSTATATVAYKLQRVFSNDRWTSCANWYTNFDDL